MLQDRETQRLKTRDGLARQTLPPDIDTTSDLDLARGREQPRPRPTHCKRGLEQIKPRLLRGRQLGPVGLSALNQLSCCSSSSKICASTSGGCAPETPSSPLNTKKGTLPRTCNECPESAHIRRKREREIGVGVEDTRGHVGVWHWSRHGFKRVTSRHGSGWSRHPRTLFTGALVTLQLTHVTSRLRLVTSQLKLVTSRFRMVTSRLTLVTSQHSPRHAAPKLLLLLVHIVLERVFVRNHLPRLLLSDKF
eukprot:1215291-Rhodomonas_salina.3